MLRSPWTSLQSDPSQTQPSSVEKTVEYVHNYTRSTLVKVTMQVAAHCLRGHC